MRNSYRISLCPAPQKVIFDNKKLHLKTGVPVRIIVDGADKNSFAAKKLKDYLLKNLKAKVIISQNDERDKNDFVSIRLTQQKKAVEALSEKKKLFYSDELGQEGYLMRVIPPSSITIAGNTPTSLLYGVLTLCQFMKKGKGRISIPYLTLEDKPAFSLRYIGGHGTNVKATNLKELIDFAYQYKINRLPFQWYEWKRGERLLESFSKLTSYARLRGIELVLGFRCFHMERDFDYHSRTDRNYLLKSIAESIEKGFRAFELMFDDQRKLETADAVDFVNSIYDFIQKKISSPELYFCPRYYGLASDQKAKSALSFIGKKLNPQIMVYFAGWWFSTPKRFQRELYNGFAKFIRRKPFYFDNMITNDYRANLIAPLPIYRPPKFHNAISGYYLNIGYPWELYCFSLISAASYTWNPYSYQPEKCFQNGIKMVFPYQPSLIERYFKELYKFPWVKPNQKLEKDENKYYYLNWSKRKVDHTELRMLTSAAHRMREYATQIITDKKKIHQVIKNAFMINADRCLLDLKMFKTMAKVENMLSYKKKPDKKQIRNLLSKAKEIADKSYQITLPLFKNIKDGKDYYSILQWIKDHHISDIWQYFSRKGNSLGLYYVSQQAKKDFVEYSSCQKRIIAELYKNKGRVEKDRLKFRIKSVGFQSALMKLEKKGIIKRYRWGDSTYIVLWRD